MKILITGGCGFLGSNIALEAFQKKYSIAIVDNLSRKGAQLNYSWLKSASDFEYHNFDISDRSKTWALIQSFQPDAVFHLAGQVAMTTSLENPILDFNTNIVGSFNILEGIRQISPSTPILYSSTNKVYGDLNQFTYKANNTRYYCEEYQEFGFDEKINLSFASPYGCSKGAADQYMLDYARVFGLKTVVLRHSSIFGERQFSTFDQGWVGWFIEKALEQKTGKNCDPFTISGDGKQVRDVLFINDIISCYFLALNHIDKAQGQAFNIGGGMSNSLSLLELFVFLEKEIDISLKYKKLPWRISDQRVFVADIRKAQTIFGWRPEINKENALKTMLRWVKNPL